MSTMFPPSSGSSYSAQDPGAQTNLLHAPPTMYPPHTHMIPYNYSAQLAVQPSSPTPAVWQTPSPHSTIPHCSTPSSIPPTPDNSYSSHLGFNGSRDAYIQGAAAAGSVHQGAIQPPLNAYQAYAASMNWRSYDMSSLQSSLQVQGLPGKS